MRIRIIGIDRSHDFNFGDAGPWLDIKKFIESQGHHIVRENFNKKIDLLVANQHSEQAIHEADYSNLPLEKRHLIYWEPKVTEGLKYRNSVRKLYGSYHTPSLEWVPSAKNFVFKWPQTRFENVDMTQNVWKERKKRVIMIQANKFSAHKEEKYSLRRKVIQLDERNSNLIDLYGENWNNGIAYDSIKYLSSLKHCKPWEISLKGAFGLGHKYVNFKGNTKSKIKSAERYKIALVIENSSNYVSEKLFDAAHAGCIVIYVGQKLELMNLHKGGILQIDNSHKNIYKCINELLNLSLEEQFKIATMQRNYLSQKADSAWESSTTLTDIFSRILKRE